MESEEEEEEKENITGSKDVGRRRYHSEHDRNGEKPQNKTRKKTENKR